MRNLTEMEMDTVSGAVPFIALPLIVIMIPAPVELPTSTTSD